MWGGVTKQISTIDVHCEGEPARVVTAGLPNIPGDSMMQKRQYCMDHLDHYRKVLLQEPRGYPCQNADYLVPPCNPEAVYGVIIVEQGKVYPAMSGHNIMCVSTALIETGMVETTETAAEFKLDTPAGLVTIQASIKSGKATSITILNVDSWCEKLDLKIDLPDRVVSAFNDVIANNTFTVDIAYGGMWYVIVDVAQFNNLNIAPEQGRLLCRLGEVLKQLAKEAITVRHPQIGYEGPDILAFVDRTADANAVIMSNQTFSWDDESTWSAIIDRSPCGSGTCAMMATKYARKELSTTNNTFTHKSILGTEFVGKVRGEVTVPGTPRPGIRPSISGAAWITQFSTVVIHPSDPFQEGFTVGDIW